MSKIFPYVEKWTVATYNTGSSLWESDTSFPRGSIETFSEHFSSTSQVVELADGSRGMLTPSNVYNREPITLAWHRKTVTDAFLNQLTAYVGNHVGVKIVLHDDSATVIEGYLNYVDKRWDLTGKDQYWYLQAELQPFDVDNSGEIGNPLGTLTGSSTYYTNTMYEPKISTGLTTQFWRGDKTWASVPGSNLDHSALNNLTYALSGHTGFQATLNTGSGIAIIGNTINGTEDQNIFNTINVEGTDITANSINTVLNIRSGAGIKLIGNNTSKTLTIEATDPQGVHSSLTNLDYANSGHTGFQPTLNLEDFVYTTGSNMTGNLNVTGDISATEKITIGNGIIGELDLTGLATTVSLFSDNIVSSGIDGKEFNIYRNSDRIRINVDQYGEGYLYSNNALVLTSNTGNSGSALEIYSETIDFNQYGFATNGVVREWGTISGAKHYVQSTVASDGYYKIVCSNSAILGMKIAMSLDLLTNPIVTTGTLGAGGTTVDFLNITANNVYPVYIYKKDLADLQTYTNSDKLIMNWYHIYNGDWHRYCDFVISGIDRPSHYRFLSGIANNTPVTVATLDNSGFIITGSGYVNINSNGSIKNNAQYEKHTTVTDSLYTVTEFDNKIYANAVSNPIYIVLPSSLGEGRVLSIKKIDSSSNSVYITGSGVLIDGSQMVDIGTQYNSMTVQDIGSNIWYIN